MASCRITAHVTTGQPFPGGWTPMGGDPANVLMMSAEDDVDEVIVPRLVACGADMKRVTIRGFTLNDDLFLDEEGLEVIEWQAKVLQPKFIVIDPLVSFMGEKVDMHRSNEVRPILRRLGRLAVKLDASVCCIAHLNKDEAKKAGNRLAGTADFRNGARSLLLAGRIDDEPERGRVIVHDKANYAREGTPIGYDVEEAPVDGVGDIGTAVWRESTDLTASEVFGGGRPTRSQRAVIKEIIRTRLAQEPTLRLDSTRVKELLKAAFPKASDTTIRRACKELGIRHHRHADGSGRKTGGSDWELPELMWTQP